MHEGISTYWAKLNTGNLLRRNLYHTVAVASFAVVLIVFWCLKLTGVTLAGEAFCGRTEHIHAEKCFLKTLTCSLTETPTAETAAPGEGGEGAAAGRELVYFVEDDCTLLPPEVHVHIDACYVRTQACTAAEHTHDKTCYSDLEADLESREDWEKLLAELGEGTTTAANVVTLAQSQVGYQESERNFEVDDDLTRHGITRYGQWYGNPYGDWSAMFASFCLYYAGVEDAPANAGPESMRLEWAAEDLYRPAAEFAPRVGDVIFLRTETAPEEEEPVPAVMTFKATRSAEPAADTVALIKEITEESVTVIQGDVDGTVTEVTYSLDDPAVLGYGLVPEVSAYAARAVPGEETTYVARTINYSTGIFTSNRSFVIYTAVGTNYYAIDGAGRAVPVYIDTSGEIRMDEGNRDDLLWNFTQNGRNWSVRNRGTGMYLHPHNNGSTDNGVLTTGNWPVALTASGQGARIGHTTSGVYARLTADQTAFDDTRSQGEAAIFQFGVVEQCTVTLDGTYSNVVGLQGSDKSSITVMAGDTLVLPTAWKSPEKYAYVMQGWYDVKNGRYYETGEEITVTENLLLYPDWVAETYDIGVMNGHVVEVASTAEYVTTHVFDYNPLFNTMSANNNYSGGDSAEWTLVSSGAVRPSGRQTLDFVFVDYDTTGVITYPHERNINNGTEYTQVTPGLYDPALAKLLFDPDTYVLGKTYLGTGDHLFRYSSDPGHEHYGYYYYDSALNAASYNQSRQRFYVYDYLARTTDSAGNDSYSDFLPLNSPYANTNGKSTGTYTYPGESGEYVGVNHISYDTKYSDNSNSTNRMGTNFWFGMATEIEFYLPAKPGVRDENGKSPNQSIVGEDMIFEFSGDDDVWVLIDGELVLDIGGVHTEKSGHIDFATGDVVVEGQVTGNVRNLAAGNHTLTMYYLERGGSMSNYMLRFNISPRYSMTLRKEDTLTAHMLNGAEFSIWLDEDCTVPAQLWTSREAFRLNRPATHVFQVADGVATMWGFVAGGTYYMKEMTPPDDYPDAAVEGIVRLRLNSEGRPDYAVLPDENDHLTVGFTAHGFKVDEDTQAAYLVISNTDATDSPPTEVYVEKVWKDNADHTGETVTVYLMANGIQIQSVTLGADNHWQHTWTNLPEQDANGDPVDYTVREATVPGYWASVEVLEGAGGSGSSGGSVTATGTLEDGGIYLLQTPYGYIAADSGGLVLVNGEAAARASDDAQWVADVHGSGTLTLTNLSGRTLYYDNYTFRASSTPGVHRNLGFHGELLYWYYDHGSWQETLYPIDNENVASNVTHNRVFYTANTVDQAMTIRPYRLGGDTAGPDGSDSQTGSHYRITNTPLGEDTVFLTVRKAWDVGELGKTSLYESLTVQLRLLADGEDTGITGTASLRNGWTCTFPNLPKHDGSGGEISYTVEELPLAADNWTVSYGPVISTGTHTYETTVTNTYHVGVQLPETVGRPPFGYTLSGVSIILGALGWYCGQRRRQGRRGR